jgi:hypothetical protein
MNTTAVLVALSLFLSSFNLSNSNKTETKWVTNSKGTKLHKEAQKQYNNRGDIIKWVQYLDDSKPICQIYTYKYPTTIKVNVLALFVMVKDVS